MKQLLSLTLGIALCSFTGFISPAFAGPGCGPEAAGCTTTQAKQAAKDCPGAKEDECCSAAEDVNMAKGGASDSAKQTGYDLGQRVPNFTLPDTTGKEHSLSAYDGKVKMIVFYNQQCPYIVEAKDRINTFAKEYKEKGVVVLGVDAGTNNKPESIAKEAEGLDFPILVNSDSNLARKFEATRTPEIYLLDKNNELVYTGMFDSGKVAEGQERKTPAKDAVEALLTGQDVTVQKTKAFGCSIKLNPNTE